MTTAFQADAFQVTGFQIDSGVVVVIPDVAPSAGNWDKVRKYKGPKKRKTRYSDLVETVLIEPVPPLSIDEPEDDDDKILKILMAIMTRVLH